MAFAMQPQVPRDVNDDVIRRLRLHLLPRRGRPAESDVSKPTRQMVHPGGRPSDRPTRQTLSGGAAASIPALLPNATRALADAKSGSPTALEVKFRVLVWQHAHP
jgi:hypothetical protein